MEGQSMEKSRRGSWLTSAQPLTAWYAGMTTASPRCFSSAAIQSLWSIILHPLPCRCC